MWLKDFDFPLPDSHIATEPVRERDTSRLLVLGRDGIGHRQFHDIVNYLGKGDMLLLNNTKVLPARLRATKPTGGRLDILLVTCINGNRWQILCRQRYTGRVDISGLPAEIEEGRFLNFSGTADELQSRGEMPLPPYIKRRPHEMDRQWYQTVYASAEGSIAAPTAGLHFTTPLIDSIRAKGVLLRYLTLHIGPGTFNPIRAAQIKNHLMEPEHFEIPLSLINEITSLKGRLIAVGTTTTRAIEGLMSGRYNALASGNGVIRGTTDIFIYPGYRFMAVGSLITNFHLPCSTPLMLASAFAGRERLLLAYRDAIRLGYRFFSYGDAMLVL